MQRLCDIIHSAVWFIITGFNVSQIAGICTFDARRCNRGRKKLICRQRIVNCIHLRLLKMLQKTREPVRYLNSIFIVQNTLKQLMHFSLLCFTMLILMTDHVRVFIHMSWLANLNRSVSLKVYMPTCSLQFLEFLEFGQPASPLILIVDIEQMKS